MRKTITPLAAVAVLALAGCSGAVEAAKENLGITASPSASSAPAEPDRAAQAAKIAAAVDKAVKGELQVKTYQEACGKVAWACPISEVRAGANPGYVEVLVQEDLTEAEAEKVAMNVFNFAGLTVPDVEWVIVYDSSQSVAGQVKRSDVPLLNR